jgi:hypothetical protein
VVRGQVRIPVTAEAGSRIAVRESDREVAAATATGRVQVIAFRADDGSHEYAVSATDSAGNESVQAVAAGAEVDGTPPSIQRLAVEPAVPSSVSSTVRFVTEPGAAFAVSVSGRREVVRGTADSTGAATAELWLPNGRYRLSVVARDQAGNVRRTVTRLAVAIAHPAFRLARTSEDGANPVVFAVTGPRRSTGAVTIGTRTVRYALDDADRTVVTVPLPDGRYSSVRAVLSDAVGRRAASTFTGFTVDTAGPELAVQVDQVSVEHGQLSITVTTEPGSAVVIDAGAAGRRELRADDGNASVTLPAETGRYDLVVTSTDEFGNQTRRPLSVSVTKPITAAEIVAGLIALVLLVGIPTLAGWLLWRRRDRMAAWRSRRRQAAEQRAAAAAHAKAVATHQAALAAHTAARHRWSQEHDRWTTRRCLLQSLVDTAETDCGTRPPDFTVVKLRSDERVYDTVDGGLVELRRSADATRPMVVQAGSVAITSHRIVFNGQKRREWSYDKLVDVTHPAPGQTMLLVSNRQKSSGVDYSGPSAERVRVLIDLAIADPDGRRANVIAQLRRDVVAHDQREPREPTDLSPTPPPSPMTTSPTGEGRSTVTAGERRR